MGIIEDVSHSTINMKIKKKCDSGPLKSLNYVEICNCNNFMMTASFPCTGVFNPHVPPMPLNTAGKP